MTSENLSFARQKSFDNGTKILASRSDVAVPPVATSVIDLLAGALYWKKKQLILGMPTRPEIAVLPRLVCTDLVTSLVHSWVLLLSFCFCCDHFWMTPRLLYI